MPEKPSARIMNKIKNVACKEAVKKFLLEMLYYELENIEEAHPFYSKYYDLYIDKYSKGFTEKP